MAAEEEQKMQEKSAVDYKAIGYFFGGLKSERVTNSNYANSLNLLKTIIKNVLKGKSYSQFVLFIFACLIYNFRSQPREVQEN